MLPVFISLIGTELNSETRLFIGWFGPRGLATVICTVLLSVLLHGISANPWAARLARQAKATASRLSPDVRQ
jgi:NhaP-type Na+/H+ or K+/H+ antiporter